PHFGGELHVQFAQEQQPVGGVGVEHEDGFAAEESVLGAAEAECVDAGVGRDGTQADALGGGRVGEAGTVEVYAHPEPVGVVGDGAQFVGRVDGAEFGGVGDADGEGLGAVFIAPPPRL